MSNNNPSRGDAAPIGGLKVPLCNPAAATTTTWLTPPSLIKTLGPFDLDPATPKKMPWRTATRMLTEKDDGLKTPWPKHDFAFINPPYGKGMDKWMAKAADHGHGFVLIFGRTDTGYFHDSVFAHANTTAVFWFRGRLKFCKPDGTADKAGSSPSVLIAYGPEARRRMIQAAKNGQIHGRLIDLNLGQKDVWQLGRVPLPKAQVRKAA